MEDREMLDDRISEARKDENRNWLDAMARLGFYGNPGLSPEENLKTFAAHQYKYPQFFTHLK